MFHVVIVLAVVGLLLWLFNTYATMIDAKIKQIINIVVVVFVILWLLNITGVLGSAHDVPVPHI